MISKEHKKVCTALNYIKHLLISASVLTECVSISPFASLVGIPIDIASPAVRLKICVVISSIKKYQSVIKKRGRGMIK